MKALKLLLTISALCISLAGCESRGSKAEKPIVVLDNETTASDGEHIPTEAELREQKLIYIQTLINDNIHKNSSVSDDLDALKDLDPESYVRWELIIDYWNKVNEKGFVGGELLPEGLPDDDSLCLVVLGYQLNTDGSMRDELVGRLETALACHNQYDESYILVTGGGTASGNPYATEADCMAEWLIDNGVSADKIIIENRSRTTVENANFSYNILINEYPGIHNIAMITSDYHIPLGCMLFNSQFLMDESMDIDNLKIVANAAYILDGHSGFSMQSQGDWLSTLYTYQ